MARKDRRGAGPVKSPYLPGIDGLRALAVAAVVVYHADHEWLTGGFLGVEVFFVISGYLITLLLIEEQAATGRIRLGQFWLRRFRRLMPALLVMLAGIAVYMSVTNMRARGRVRGDFVAGLAYGSNWYQLAIGQGYAAAEAFVPLRHLWSLAVEEQFYLVWPLVMWVVLKLGRAALPRVGLWLALFSVGIAVAMGLLFAAGDIDNVDNCLANPHGYLVVADRCISINDGLYLSTISRAGGLLLGAAFAMVWRPLALLRGPMRRKWPICDVIALVGLAGLAWLSVNVWLEEPGVDYGVRFNPWLFRGGFLVVGICTLMVISSAAHPRAAVGRVLLGNPLLRYVGTRSYGIYLFHWPIYQIIRKQAGVALTLQEFALAMAITLVISELSYRFVETPIRHGAIGATISGRRRRERRQAGGERGKVATLVAVASVALVAFAGVSFARAANVCVGPVECQQAVADAAAAEPTGAEITQLGPTPSTTVAPPTTIAPATVAPPSDPADGAATTVAAPTTAPVATTIAADPFEAIAPYAVGESVMQGAITNLRAGGFDVNAEQSRGGDQVVEVLRLLRERGQLGPILVIQVGTNGRVDDEQFDQMMAVVGDRTTVWFMTVRAPRQYIQGNNERIRALPARYPNVRIIDWATESEQIVGQLCGGADQRTHISCDPAAARFYANLVFTAVGMDDQVR